MSIYLRIIPTSPKYGLLPVPKPKHGKVVTTFDLYILSSGGFEFWVQKSCQNADYSKTWTAFWLSISGQSSVRWTSYRSRYVHLIDECLPWFF